MKKLFLILTVSLFFFSCDNSVYKEYYEFSLIQWEQDETPVFDFELKESKQYDVVFTMRYISGFPYKNMIGSLLLTDLNANASLKNFKFQIVDDNNEYIGDVGGNMWDIEYTVFSDTLLNAGEYSVSVEQFVEAKTLPFVYDVGLKIVPIEEQK
jgi:gliding motility-associated lipoprotein GldH